MRNTEPISRRTFVQGLPAAAALAPAILTSGKSLPSNRVRIGLIGCGGRGRELLNVFRQFPDVDVPVISDVFEPRMEQAAKILAEGDRPQKPDLVVEHERILDRKDVDAVLIATTQHWHGIPFIQAAQTGKHIYVEKPFSHTVVEGRAMVEAARRSGVLAMMGAQQRGYPHYVKAFEILRGERLGKIALVECWNYEKLGRRVGKPADADPPAGLHWDRCLGPAPLVPFNPARLSNSWWFDYGGGMMTNWAIHHIDIILSAMQVSDPTAVSCSGGKFVVDDLADTPDTIAASWEFPGFVMQYSYRGFNSFRTVQNRPYNHGICFHGSRATMVLDRSGYETWEERDPAKSVEQEDNPRHWGDGKPGNEVDGPWQRLFLDCLKENKRPPVDLEQSHKATVCCHLANIAYRECGRELNGDRGLAQAFLFGDRQSALKVQQVQGSAAANVTLGGSAEATTTTDMERAKRQVEFPSWTSVEFAYRGSRWLFIINSANAPAAFTLSGWPSGFGGEDAFTGKAMENQNGSSRQLNLPAYGVAGLRFPLAGPAEQNK